MVDSIIISEQVKRRFTARATLVAIGRKVQAEKIVKPIVEKVKIAQKTVKFTPADKLQDAYINILAGAHGMVEINKRVRPDRALQEAFGRSGCAEQSVVQNTLDACTEDNVKQMQQAMQCIYRQHSRGYRHAYNREWLLLDIDTTGRPCGKKAAFATKGYFAHQRNRRGRQGGYVVAVLEELCLGRSLLGN